MVRWDALSPEVKNKWKPPYCPNMLQTFAWGHSLQPYHCLIVLLCTQNCVVVFWRRFDFFHQGIVEELDIEIGHHPKFYMNANDETKMTWIQIPCLLLEMCLKPRRDDFNRFFLIWFRCQSFAVMGRNWYYQQQPLLLHSTSIRQRLTGWIPFFCRLLL